MNQMRLLCDANPMCYGSSSAMLAILDHLPAISTAIIDETTESILGQDKSVSRVVRVNPKNFAEVSQYLNRERFDAVLVVSNQSNIEVYLSAGIPIFFVDILYWYGARKDQIVWQKAERCFVQAFPGVRERIREQSYKPPLVVGPLIRPMDASATQVGTLVNLGGGSSRWVSPGENSPYPQLVAGILKGLFHCLPRPIVVAGGGATIKALNQESNHDFQGKTLTQREVLSYLRGCEVYLTAPGLNAVFEGLERGLPVSFLPPQNASQVFQLRRYERAGLIASGLNLPELVQREFPPLDFARDEHELTNLVLGSLWDIAASPELLSRIVTHIETQLKTSQQRKLSQQSFRRELGSLGGVEVANYMMGWWQAK